jgi:hypothetical protein
MSKTLNPASGEGATERKERAAMRRILLAISIIALFALAYGCQWLDTGTAPEAANSEQIMDLDSPTGGFTFTDEEPAFGEDELFDPMFNEIAVDDSTADSTQVKELIRHRNVKIFRLRSIWGHLISTYEDTLETHNTEYCPVDWSGMMKLEGGAILIERIIAFDKGDCVTREDVGTISWTSLTGPHIDGLQVMLVVPWGPEDSTEAYVEPKLLFETGPFSRTFSLEELASLSLIEPVDRCGNGISINAHIMPAYCPYGFLAGAWKNVPPDTIAAADTNDTEKIILGVYRGIWISERGTPGGYLKGVFGVNSLGDQVFFGKYVDMTGRFKGILKGTYGTCPVLTDTAEYPYGFFRGVWINEDRVTAGGLKGHWVTREPGFGYFHGVWGQFCVEEREE